MSWFNDLVAYLGNGANWSGDGGLTHRLVQHIGYSALATAIAVLIAVPVALWLGHLGRGGTVALNVGNIGRAVPVYALVVLLVIMPKPFGPNDVSLIVALVLFAIPPLLTNGYVGVREVSRETVEAARGMGLSGWQVLRRVEVPLASPLLFNGLRLAAVQVIATATIFGLVGGGGLGRIISTGYTRQDQAQLLAGSVVVAVLALVVELALGGVQHRAEAVAAGRRTGRNGAGADGDSGPIGRDSALSTSGAVTEP